MPDMSDSVRTPLTALLTATLLIGAVLMAACADDVVAPIQGVGGNEPVLLEQVTYPLDAVSSEGTLPQGLAGEVVFQELDASRMLVTVAIDDTVDTPLIHPVHIHENDAGTGGPIAFFLGALDNNARGAARSVHVIEKSLDSLLTFNGHVNIHESNATRDTLLAQGDIGANDNASPTLFRLNRVVEPRRVAYPLQAVSNSSTQAPEGFGGEVRFEELTPSQTLVRVQADGGSPATDGAHPVHLREGRAGEHADGAAPEAVIVYLGAIDGAPESPGVSWAVVDRSYDELLNADAHVRIHLSNDALDTVLSTGDIGANAAPM